MLQFHFISVVKCKSILKAFSQRKNILTSGPFKLLKFVSHLCLEWLVYSNMTQCKYSLNATVSFSANHRKLQ